MRYAETFAERVKLGIVSSSFQLERDVPTANAAATIDTILNPRRIAIVGASKDPAKRGYRVTKTLLADNYAGEIIPINPKETEILGLRCYPTLLDVPVHVDVALIYTPASTVPAVIEQCGKSAVTGAIVIAGGFSEASEEGRLLEERVVEIAKRYNVRVAGPNQWHFRRALQL